MGSFISAYNLQDQPIAIVTNNYVHNIHEGLWPVLRSLGYSNKSSEDNSNDWRDKMLENDTTKWNSKNIHLMDIKIYTKNVEGSKIDLYVIGIRGEKHELEQNVWPNWVPGEYHPHVQPGQKVGPGMTLTKSGKSVIMGNVHHLIKFIPEKNFTIRGLLYYLKKKHSIKLILDFFLMMMKKMSPG